MTAFRMLPCDRAPQEFPLVRQRCDNDCGLAALATIAVCHGYTYTYDDLADQITLDHRGTDLLTLLRLANRVGVIAEGIEASYDDLPN